MKKIAILFFLLWYGAANLSAETLQVDIETAIKMAVKNNLSLKITEIEYNTAKRKINTIWNNFLPSIDASTSLERSDQFLTDVQNTTMTDSEPWTFKTTLGLSFSLSTGIIATIEKIKLIYEAAQISYTTAKNELVRNTKKLFFYILALNENIRLKKENIDIAYKRYLKAQSNFNNGLVPQLEVLSARVSYENQKPAYTQAQLDYKTELLNFKKLLGIENASDIELVGKLDITFYILDRDSLISKWMSEIPSLRLKMNEIKQLETSKVLIVSGNLTPILTLYGSWGTNVNDPFNGDSWGSQGLTDNVTLGISLTMPLDGFIPYSPKSVEIQEADDAVEKARLEYQELRVNTINNINTLLMQLETYREKTELSRLNSELAQQTYQMAEDSYRNGTSELLDVQNAQQELLNANQDLLMAQYQYLSAIIDLESILDKAIADIIKE